MRQRVANRAARGGAPRVSAQYGASARRPNVGFNRALPPLDGRAESPVDPLKGGNPGWIRDSEGAPASGLAVHSRHHTGEEHTVTAAIDVQSAAVIAELRALGKPNAARIYRTHGVRAETVGVSLADLGLLRKRYAREPQLAPSLWDTGLHDARMLALQIADAESLSATRIDAWVGALDNYILTDAFSGMIARRGDAVARAMRWIDAPDEWTSTVGWNILNLAALGGRLDPDLASALIPRIAATVHSAPNRTRYAMNNTLIAIGAAVEGLKDSALAAAHAIGPVQVDHGQTGCKTPDAAPYIEKAYAHRNRRSRVTSGRTG